jgi:hypothetical protein
MARITFILTGICTLLFFGNAESKDKAIGKIVTSRGSVKAQTEGASRKLKSGSEIYAGETIDVDKSSKVQIKFTDGGVMNLIPSTQLRVDNYEYGAKDNQFSAELIKGGFRALSGKISKKNPDAYSVKTPSATIGIRGTMFETNIVKEQTFFGCDYGTISLLSTTGQILLDANHFVSASEEGEFGDITTTRPAALSLSLFSAPWGGDSLDSIQQAVEQQSLESAQAAITKKSLTAKKSLTTKKKTAAMKILMK